LEDDKQPNWTLEQISFELSPGKSLAIIGSTGAGKSSIINILNRFYEISKGEIRIDDYKLQEIEVGSLRKRMAVVLQDVFLFSGTIMENITLRDPFITEEKVIAAAKAIGADTFILKLPGTYNYQVMERGATLSMGQRQMISFVRALVRDPDILILDEATSSVDPESEQMIQNAIIKLTEKRTSLIIAHRLSTISQVNEILILEKGKIIEKGSPEILLSQSDGYYKKMIEAYQLKEIG
jgi:ATP-binding cassette subfamily B protein